jgi:hypothetical protein
MPRPPSTGMTAPVTYDAPSEPSHCTTAATSSTEANRCKGIWDEAGCDDVRGDGPAAQLTGERARHADQTRLAGGVVHLPRGPEEADHGGDEDQPPTTQPEHALGGPLGHSERAGEVGVDDLAPVRLAHPQHQGVLGDAGVGDHDLDRSVSALHLGERSLDGVGVGDVASHAEDSGRRLAAAVGDGHLVTVRDERLGDGAADAAVATGHEHRSAQRTASVGSGCGST